MLAEAEITERKPYETYQGVSGITLEDNSFSRIGKLGSYAFAQFLPIASGLWEPGAAHRPTVRP